MNIKKIVLTTLALAFFFIIDSNAQETKDINNVLAKKIAYNKENPTGIGYKIQLYNGDETTAYRIQNNFQLDFEMKAELIYESPEWKVRVGNYKTRLEADRALLEINAKFSGAIVLETEIDL